MEFIPAYKTVNGGQLTMLLQKVQLHDVILPSQDVLPWQAFREKFCHSSSFSMGWPSALNAQGLCSFPAQALGAMCSQEPKSSCFNGALGWEHPSFLWLCRQSKKPSGTSLLSSSPSHRNKRQLLLQTHSHINSYFKTI